MTRPPEPRALQAVGIMRFDYSDARFEGAFGSKYLVLDKESAVFCEPFGLFRQPV